MAYDPQVTAGQTERDDEGGGDGDLAEKPIGEAQAVIRRGSARPEATAATVPPPGDPTWDLFSMADGNRAPPVQFTAFDEAPGIGPTAFLGTLVDTARFWSANQLLAAPGYRDRVVHVALRDDEGGLNLDMEAKVISDLDRRGRAAGALTAARFDPNKPDDPETGSPIEPAFPNHRWVRYRSLMAAVEDLTRRFALSRRREADAALSRSESSLDEMIEGSSCDPIDYEPDPACRRYYTDATKLWDQLCAALLSETRKDARSTFDIPRGSDGRLPRRGGAPRPKIKLTSRPLVDNDPLAEIIAPDVLPGSAAATTGSSATT